MYSILADMQEPCLDWDLWSEIEFDNAARWHVEAQDVDRDPSDPLLAPSGLLAWAALVPMKYGDGPICRPGRRGAGATVGDFSGFSAARQLRHQRLL